MSDDQLLILTYAGLILAAVFFCKFIPQMAGTLLALFESAMQWI